MGGGIVNLHPGAAAGDNVRYSMAAFISLRAQTSFTPARHEGELFQVENSTFPYGIVNQN
jgi:hypothetical protein